MAANTFKLGDVTVHRVVEQEAPLFDPLQFFPKLTEEVLDDEFRSVRKDPGRNRRVA